MLIKPMEKHNFLKKDRFWTNLDQLRRPFLDPLNTPDYPECTSQPDVSFRGPPRLHMLIKPMEKHHFLNLYWQGTGSADD